MVQGGIRPSVASMYQLGKSRSFDQMVGREGSTVVVEVSDDDSWGEICREETCQLAGLLLYRDGSESSSTVTKITRLQCHSCVRAVAR